MSWLTSRLLAKPWLVGTSVALLGAAGTTTGLIVTHHSDNVKVRVLGENFQNSTGGQAPAGGTATPRTSTGAPPSSHPGNGGAGGHSLSFTIAANVSGLVPGTPATLPVQITNPTSNGGTLTINTISVVPRDVTADGQVVCAGSNLEVTNYDSSQPGATVYAVAKGGTTTIGLPISFRDTLTVDQTPCLGKTFALNASGTGTVTRP